jgi:hypothetical protein
VRGLQGLAGVGVGDDLADAAGVAQVDERNAAATQPASVTCSPSSAALSVPAPWERIDP